MELPIDRERPLWFSCSCVPVEEADIAAESYFNQSRRRYLLLVASEITALKEREQELRTAALRAITAEQELVHSLREILSGAVFQVEGPFNLLNAAVGMLARRAASWNGSEALLDVLREADGKGREALQRLRASMPLPEHEAFDEINLNQVVRDVLSLFTERMLSEGVTVEWNPGDVPPMRGREGSLRSLFKQLIANALDAIAESQHGVRELRICSREESGFAAVQIADSGPGIPDDLRLKIFEPFYTTKSPGGRSTGMGLSVAQEVVNEHAGTLEVGPYSPSGATFCVRLPLAARDGDDQ